MKRIIPIAGITAGCGLVVAAFIFIRSSAQSPIPTITPAPAMDLSGLKAKAENGDAKAQMQLGKAFVQGAGVARDYKQAALWLGNAASNGNIEAEAMFGELYQAGQGVHQDLTNAMNWLTKAAQAGSPAAQYDLGFIYEQGRGVKKDERLAAHWYLLAAEGGDALAQFDYGQRCIVGLGVAKDSIEGLKWLLLAAAQGQTDSQARADSVQRGLSGEQVAEAKRKSAAFTPRHTGR